MTDDSGTHILLGVVAVVAIVVISLFVYLVGFSTNTRTEIQNGCTVTKTLDFWGRETSHVRVCPAAQCQRAQ